MYWRFCMYTYHLYHQLRLSSTWYSNIIIIISSIISSHMIAIWYLLTAPNCTQIFPFFFVRGGQSVWVPLFSFTFLFRESSSSFVTICYYMLHKLKEYVDLCSVAAHREYNGVTSSPVHSLFIEQRFCAALLWPIGHFEILKLRFEHQNYFGLCFLRYIKTF